MANLAIDAGLAARLPVLASQLSHARDFVGDLRRLERWQLNDGPNILGAITYLLTQGVTQPFFNTVIAIGNRLSIAMQMLGSYPQLWPLEEQYDALNQLVPYVTGPCLAQPWATTVTAAGGTISNGFRNSCDQLMKTLSDAGLIPLLADFWMPHAENAQQALVSMKLGRQGIAVNSPVFTTKVGWRFDGASNYFNTQVVPSVDGAAIGMTADDCRIAVRETVDLISNTNMMGATAPAQAFTIRPHVAAATCSGQAVTNIGTYTLRVQSSIALIAVGRSAPNAAGVVMRQDGGAPLAVSAAPTVFATALPIVAIWMGGSNGSGTLQSPRAGTVGYGSFGRYLNDAQATAEANAVNAFLTNVTREASDGPLPREDADPLMVVLTEQQARDVAGFSSITDLAALHPQPLTDGRYFLNARTVDDPVHADARDVLAACPQVPLSTLAPLLPEVEDG